MLSQKELEQVSDAEWILSKNRIIEKIEVLFGTLAHSWQEDMKYRQEKILVDSFKQPKISKGEQYQQMPWLVLDYPREFKKEDVFSVRCLFWWGHHFSVIIHVEGDYQTELGPLLSNGLQNRGWYFYKGQDRWDNQMNNGDYTSSWTQHDLGGRAFLKWVQPISFQPWDEAIKKVQTAYQEILTCLSAKSVE